ncbi:Rhodanese-like domain containing protein [Tritrichomonas foetus]|uniref:M-phase inducer phosphatase n=1 Tax=Tritrichomonas foetus TaxID=1144522 RepID=A0A1J4KNE4_9EUKA|nr:Rhodanese-like domain containing protein [Tritrichomonas foetus]|eukprot:OHT12642.1 Rhodanese-like domain containing protein [Tritrichomonas foetus]
MFCPSPVSPSRSTIPLPHLDDSPGATPPRCISFVNGSTTNDQFLPTLPLNGTVPRIAAKTLAKLLSGEYDDYYDNLYILDCRYEYEYEGGHIKGALNVDSPDVFQEMFFDTVVPNSVIVFHCEFSQNRGPQMASMFREIDRNLNKMEYPNLFYPHVFILDGGYRNFYQEYHEFCNGGYTRMLDDSHRSNGDLVKATTKYRQNVEKAENKNRKVLVAIHGNANKQNIYQSPVACEGKSQSPIVSKMLNFFTSPIAPRRI